jgi:dihydropteroate synthase
MIDSHPVWQLRDRVLYPGQRPLVLGIVNVTPDSFSDGGSFASPQAAIEHGLTLVQEGADLLDVGGESSRPGATPVSLEQELSRVVPVVRGLVAQTNVPLSVDTTKAEVARQALEAGALVINDITALRGDAEMASVVHQYKAGVILMHMQGTPANMQVNPAYQNVVQEVADFLQERLQAAANVGIGGEQVVLDPGIGFGKTAEHNFRLIAHLDEVQRLGRPVCLGVSRKGFLGKLLGRPVGDRLAVSVAAACYAVARHTAQIFRVHDVAATRDAIALFTRLEEEQRPH